MRVTDASRYDMMRQRIQATGAEVSRASERLTTGRKINRLSDDPDRAVLAERLRAESSAIETYARAADNAKAWLGTQDTALQTASSLMHRARELAISASSVQSDSARAGIAEEIEGLRDQMIEVANTRFNGRSVFGGFGDTTVADTGTGISFVGDTGQVAQRVSETLTVTINVSGYDAFGFSAGDDVFTVLTDLAAAARTGDVDTTANSGLARLQARAADLAQALGSVGSRANGIEMARRAGEDRAEEIRSYRSSIVDADLAESTLDLTLAETSYEAVLAATARLDRVSLMDFL